jgi:hypothetical protein
VAASVSGLAAARGQITMSSGNASISDASIVPSSTILLTFASDGGSEFPFIAVTFTGTGSASVMQRDTSGNAGGNNLVNWVVFNF